MSQGLLGAVAAVLIVIGQARLAAALPPQTTTLTPVSATASTGEKPQSKVWLHAGSWWSVLPNASGTWLRRLDGTTWTDQLKLSDATNGTADVKVLGDVAHVLLYRGTTSELASVEYIAGSNTYQLWTSRQALSTVTLDSGVEIATIDVDSQGRMWLASDGSTTILVRYSDPPYETWSAPITLATGVSTDDISVVTALPNGSVGVLWSNQSTRRFGFRLHVDGADPATWAEDEVPASQSALEVGLGMADDHLNVAVASDATLYAAVKTSYDTGGYPKIALLVRRPAGTWDGLYSVDEAGTRGIGLLNETAGTITIVYTSSEGSGDIVYKESPISPSIVFGSRSTLIPGGHNDVTSTKQNITDSVVLLAHSTSNSNVDGVLRSTASSPPTATLTSPDGGEVWEVGSSHDITWDATDDVGVTAVDLELSTNGGGTWSAIVSGLSNTGTYAWTVPGSPTIAGRVQVTAHDGDANSTSDMSDANFEIQAPGTGPTVTVTVPNGGEAWTVGTSHDITWIATDDVGVTAVDLELSTDGGGTWSAIATGLSNTGTYAWTVPGTPTATARVQATAHDGDANTASDMSDANFAIQTAVVDLMGHWPMEEGSGTTVFDVSGQGNDGALTGGPTWEPGVRGTYALSLDGSTQYALVSDDPTLDFTNAITMAAWIKPEKVATQYVVKKATQGGVSGYEISLSAAGKPFIRFNQQTSGDTYRINALTSYPTNGTTWMHVAGTYDGSVMRLYINGVQEGSDLAGPASIATNVLPLGIGAQSDGGVKFQGAIDDVRLYGRALSAGEILGLVSSGVPTVTVTSPNGGEAWAVGASHDITWTAVDDVGVTSVDLELSTDGGGSWSAIATGLSNTGSYAWTVPNAPTATARVRATAYDGDANSASDVSDANFEIRGPIPTVTVTSPDGGEVWTAGTSHAIFWIATDDVGVTSVDLDLSTDGGGTWSSIASGLSNTGSYVWPVPESPSTTARVRATAYDGDANSASDASGADFEIRASGGLTDLVGQWPMEEGSGPTVFDVSGYGNDGTLQGSATWVTGVQGALALHLGGSTYATVPDDPSLDITEAITLSAWIRPAVQGTEYIIKKATMGATSGYELSLSTVGVGKPFVRFNQATNGNLYRLDSTIEYPTDGLTWMHLAATYDGATIRIFVNGVEDSAKAASFAIASNVLPLGIGAQGDGTSKFTGDLDDVRVYGRALSAAEILALASHTITAVAGAGGSIDPAGTTLVVHGGGQAYSITANPGYEIEDVLVDGGSIGPQASYNFVGVTTDHTIEATFSELLAVGPAVPKSLSLSGGHPNPFSGRTTIVYALPRSGRVQLRVFDLMGRLVATLVDGVREPGEYPVAWDGRRDDGTSAGSGVYLARLDGCGETRRHKLLLAR